MRIVGIDPGITGAIALLEDGKASHVADMPVMQRGATSKKQMVNAAELARLVRDLRADVAVVELVMGAPRKVGGESVMGAASAFNFGDTAGCIRGVLGALGNETHYVTPATWKKRAGLAGNRDKEASRSLAIRLYPAASLARKKDSGRAEALLIARYGLKELAAPAYADPFEMDREPPASKQAAPSTGLLL